MIKRIIAREGLVILGILAISSALIWGPDYIIPSRPSYDLLPTLNNLNTAPKDMSDAIGKIMELREKYPQYDDLTNMELVSKIAKKYPAWQNVDTVMQRINEDSQKKPVSFNFATAKPVKINRLKLSKQISTVGDKILIFTYPFYLLIRFIFWAINTLRKKRLNEL